MRYRVTRAVGTEVHFRNVDASLIMALVLFRCFPTQGAIRPMNDIVAKAASILPSDVTLENVVIMLFKA